MLNNKGFDLWADGYDKTVGVSDEENSYPFAGYREILGRILRPSWKSLRLLSLILGLEPEH